jgi:hypothetical protein
MTLHVDAVPFHARFQIVDSFEQRGQNTSPYERTDIQIDSTTLASHAQ